MKKAPIMGLLLLFIFSGSVQAQAMTTPIKIDKRAFIGFEKCQDSKTLSKVIDKLFKNTQPAKKRPGVFTYVVDSEIFGIPISKIDIGVCEDGSRSCGWASLIGLTLDLPLSAAKKRLYQLTKKDFTQELREKETEATLRPVLFKHPSRDRSFLFCDAGHL